MITVNFYLKGAISKDKQELFKKSDPDFLNSQMNTMLQIYLMVSIPNERIGLYTGKRIKQSFWDRSKQQANCKKMREGCEELNQWLHELKSRTLKKCQQLENEGIRISKDEIRAVIDEKRISKLNKTDLTELMNTFLSKQRTSTGNSLKPASKSKYLGLVKHLKAYFEIRRINFSLDQVNIKMLEDFREYLIHDIGHTDNSVVKYLKNAKTFLKFYMDQGKIKPMNLSALKTVEKEGEIYILPVNQIRQLQNMELTDPVLCKVRDVFCFMCWTGQRFSDISKIRWEQITHDESGNKVWELISSKTNDHIRVPIIKQAQQIIERYIGQPTPLPMITSEKMNNSLKAIGQLASFNNQAKVVRYRDGIKQEKYIPFYNVLTTHVARKSFITNSLMLGVPERVVREVSGHKDEKSFRRYAKLVDSYKHEAIRNAYEGLNS